MCTLNFKTSRVAEEGEYVGVVQLKLLNGNEFNAKFNFTFRSAITAPAMDFAFPTVGAASGGTPVTAILNNVAIEDVSKDTTVVHVGDLRVLVEVVTKLSDSSVELGFLTPAFACSEVACSKSVVIESLNNPDISLSFPFEYKSKTAYVSEVFPSQFSASGGSIFTVKILNFPVVSFVDEVKVYFPDLQIEQHPEKIVGSDPLMTELDILLPQAHSVIAEGRHTLMVDLEPVFHVDGMVRATVQVASDTPSLVSFAPASRDDLLKPYANVFFR